MMRIIWIIILGKMICCEYRIEINQWC